MHPIGVGLAVEEERTGRESCVAHAHSARQEDSALFGAGGQRVAGDRRLNWELGTDRVRRLLQHEAREARAPGERGAFLAVHVESNPRSTVFAADLTRRTPQMLLRVQDS